MPGLILTTSLADESPPANASVALAEQAVQPLLHNMHYSWNVHVQEQDIFLASAEPPANRAIHAQCWTNKIITVAMSGYLTESADAQFIAEQFANHGNAGVERLNGSFVIIIVDRRRPAVMLWTDRVGSRPCFRALLNNVLVVAPELKCFTGLPSIPRELVPGSLAAMAMNGALLDEHTYYRDVHLVGPARRIVVDPTGINIKRYWRRTFRIDPDQPKPSPQTVCDLLCRATQRHLARFRRPILALSGGLDSRIILAAAQRLGIELPAIVWGFDQLQTPGSDFQVGRAAGRLVGIEPRLRNLDVDQLPNTAEQTVYLTDGLTGHLGNYTEGDALAAELATKHDALVRGDEMFGWAAAVSTPEMALRRVGINVGKRLRLLQFLLRDEVAESVLADYHAQQEELLGSLDVPFNDRSGARRPQSGRQGDGPLHDANDLKDMLYWRTRFPRLIASQAAIFRPHLDVICPLLDAEVLDLVGNLSTSQRVNKHYITKCVRRSFPEQFSLPLNTAHSRTSWRKRLRKLGPAQRFMVETLLEPLPSFDQWFDRTAIRAWLAAATAEGKRTSWPADSTWRRRASTSARALFLRPTFKERVILNLVTLKLWLKIS